MSRITLPYLRKGDRISIEVEVLADAFPGDDAIHVEALGASDFLCTADAFRAVIHAPIAEGDRVRELPSMAEGIALKLFEHDGGSFAVVASPGEKPRIVSADDLMRISASAEAKVTEVTEVTADEEPDDKPVTATLEELREALQQAGSYPLPEAGESGERVSIFA